MRRVLQLRFLLPCLPFRAALAEGRRWDSACEDTNLLAALRRLSADPLRRLFDGRVLSHLPVSLNAFVSHAEFHPRTYKIVLATLTCNEVVLVDLRNGQRRVLEDDMDGEEAMDVDGNNEERANGKSRKK